VLIDDSYDDDYRYLDPPDIWAGPTPRGLLGHHAACNVPISKQTIKAALNALAELPPGKRRDEIEALLMAHTTPAQRKAAAKPTKDDIRAEGDDDEPSTPDEVETQRLYWRCRYEKRRRKLGLKVNSNPELGLKIRAGIAATAAAKASGNRNAMRALKNARAKRRRAQWRQAAQRRRAKVRNAKAGRMA